MGANTNKKSNAGKNVLVFFIVFIILEMLIIFGVGKVFKNKDVTPSFAGYSLYMTNSELTAKNDDGTYDVSVPKGVLVIASNGLTNATEKIGTAVLCEKVEGVGTGVFWLADVNSNEGGDGVVYTISNGDKFYNVTSKNIVGGTSSYFKTAGTVITFITSKFGMIVCAIVPLFFLVLIELIIAIATHSPEEEEEDDEDEKAEEVKLDDFLFGGQNEGEQIAKRRHQLEQQAEQDYSMAVKEDIKPMNKVEEPETKDDFDFDFGRKPAQKEPKTKSVSDDLKMSAPEEKTSMILDDEPVVPAPKAAQHVQKRPAPRRPRPQGQRPAQRTAKPSAGSASLEDLMKLMEEEQNRLKNQMK